MGPNVCSPKSQMSKLTVAGTDIYRFRASRGLAGNLRTELFELRKTRRQRG